MLVCSQFLEKNCLQKCAFQNIFIYKLASSGVVSVKAQG